MAGESCPKCGSDFWSQVDYDRAIVARVLPPSAEDRADKAKELTRQIGYAESGRCPNCGHPSPLRTWCRSMRWRLPAAAGGIVCLVGIILVVTSALNVLTPLKKIDFPWLITNNPRYIVREVGAMIDMPLVLRMAIGTMMGFCGMFTVALSGYLAECEWDRYVVVALMRATASCVGLAFIPLVLYSLAALLWTRGGSLLGFGGFLLGLIGLLSLYPCVRPLIRWNQKYFGGG